jgi:hypothetical protein
MANHKQGNDVKGKVKMGAAGILAGFINGLLGSGGGVLIVLYLTIFAKTGRKDSQATAIAVILPLAVLSSIIYARGGYVAWSHLWKVSVGGVAGAILGAVLLNRLKPKFIKKLFAVFLVIAGVRMFF